jgi:hypothetical protein
MTNFINECELIDSFRFLIMNPIIIHGGATDKIQGKEIRDGDWIIIFFLQFKR